MNRVMLDLETMGNTPNAAIIAIGAVHFNEEKVLDAFQVIVDLQNSVDNGLCIDPSTVLWWLQQSDDARKEFEKEGIFLGEALQQFNFWIGPDAEVWGNGSAFDNVILRNAYHKCGITPPWAFWNDRCYRTIKNLYPEIPLKREGVYHRAVDDASSQAAHLIKMMKGKWV